MDEENMKEDDKITEGSVSQPIMTYKACYNDEVLSSYAMALATAGFKSAE